MGFILDHKWFFFIAAEVLFWLCAIGFIICRYLFKLDKLSVVLFVVFIVNDLWIALLGYMDYQRTGEISTFQIIIIIFIVYALSFGKSDFKKLDGKIKRWIASKRGEYIDEANFPKPVTGVAYAIQEWKGFGVHFVLFIIAHFIFYISFGLSSALQEAPLQEWFGLWFNKDSNHIPFHNEQVNKVSKVWLLIFLIDFVITCSYTIFPKKAV